MVTSRNCPIHGPNSTTTLSSNTSSVASLISAEDWKALHNSISRSDVSLFYEQELPTHNAGPKTHERVKRSIEGLLLQVCQIRDAPQVAGYIAGLLSTQGCNRTMYSYVKDTVLATCRRLKEEVVCYCETESSQRLRPSMALLGHLVKLEVIPGGAVLTFAESLLQEIDRPYRIECVFLLLVDPASGILTDRKYAYLLDRSLKQMRERRDRIVALNRG